MKKVLIILLILVLLVTIGVFLYQHFVINRISDWGGMENPDQMDFVAQSSDVIEQATSTHQILQEEHHGTV